MLILSTITVSLNAQFRFDTMSLYSIQKARNLEELNYNIHKGHEVISYELVYKEKNKPDITIYNRGKQLTPNGLNLLMNIKSGGIILIKDIITKDPITSHWYKLPEQEISIE